MIMFMIIKYMKSTPNFTTATCIVIRPIAVVVLLFYWLYVSRDQCHQGNSSRVLVIDG